MTSPHATSCGNRLGEQLTRQTHKITTYGEQAGSWAVRKVSFHSGPPSRFRPEPGVEVDGEVWVARATTGSRPTGCPDPFEPIKLSPFYHRKHLWPAVFRWPINLHRRGEINAWWGDAPAQGKNGVFWGLRLGQGATVPVVDARAPKSALSWTHTAPKTPTRAARQGDHPARHEILGDADLNPARTTAGAIVLAHPVPWAVAMVQEFGPQETAFPPADGWPCGVYVDASAGDRGFNHARTQCGLGWTWLSGDQATEARKYNMSHMVFYGWSQAAILAAVAGNAQVVVVLRSYH